MPGQIKHQLTKQATEVLTAAADFCKPFCLKYFAHVFKDHFGRYGYGAKVFDQVGGCDADDATDFEHLWH